MELWERPATALADAVRSGEISASELLEMYLGRIERAQPDLNAFVFLDADGARKRPAAIDAEVRAGRDPGPLGGLPLAVKELTPVEGWPDTHASRAFEDDIAPA